MRFTAGQLHHLSLVLGIMVNQRLLVEGTLDEEGHNSCNVQVVFVEYSSEAVFMLWDKDGKFLTVPVAESIVTHELPEPMEHKSARSSVELTEDADDLETLNHPVADFTTERYAYTLQQVTVVLEQKKARTEELWRMNCGQVEKYNTMVVAKDNEIAALKAQLAEQKSSKEHPALKMNTLYLSRRGIK